jgi:hypothetical protein
MRSQWALHLTAKQERDMKALDSMNEMLLDALDDVPPPPPSYTEYVERTMRDRIQDAYERGLEHGCRHRVLILIIGVIVGWFLGLSYATT